MHLFKRLGQMPFCFFGMRNTQTIMIAFMAFAELRFHFIGIYFPDIMKLEVFGNSHNLKIFRSIVEAITIDVMYHFVGFKWATKRLFCDKLMGIAKFSVNQRLVVPGSHLFGRFTSTFVRHNNLQNGASLSASRYCCLGNTGQKGRIINKNPTNCFA
jgi:hypothetical protein